MQLSNLQRFTPALHLTDNTLDKAAQYFSDFSDKQRITLVGPLVATDLVIEEPVIFVDGGSSLRENGIGIAVGDGDSSLHPMDILLDPDKDFSDLAFALSLVPQSITELDIVGFLGGRRDHELFNIGEVVRFLRHRPKQTRVAFDRSAIALSGGKWQLSIDGLFSLMAVEPALVTLQGQCRYPIDPAKKIEPLSSFGLSNIGSGVISIENSNPILLLSDEVTSVTPEPAGSDEIEHEDST